MAKMRQYRLTPQRVKRIIRYPARTEVGILENAIAVMQPVQEGGRARSANPERYSEIWAMYAPIRGKIRIITAWRYPGRAPARDPVPKEILRDISTIIGKAENLKYLTVSR